MLFVEGRLFVGRQPESYKSAVPLLLVYLPTSPTITTAVHFVSPPSPPAGCPCALHAQSREEHGRGREGTMADDDIDLDAMLDSALDEGFADPPEAGGAEGDGEIDLDAMLDEAMV